MKIEKIETIETIEKIEYSNLIKVVLVAALAFSLFFPSALLAEKIADNNHIQKDKLRWKTSYIESAPRQVVNQWVLPFKTKNRADIKTTAIISTFAAKRLSYVRGHFHTGVDLIPRKRNGQYVYVYPMAPGVVCSVHLGAPHHTVVVKHTLADGSVLFTSYKHLQDSYINNGDQVTPETRLGRLYTRTEARALGGNYHHLHLEIRKNFDDYGVASWATLTKAELNQRFIDPQVFMKNNIKAPTSSSR